MEQAFNPISKGFNTATREMPALQATHGMHPMENFYHAQVTEAMQAMQSTHGLQTTHGMSTPTGMHNTHALQSSQGMHAAQEIRSTQGTAMHAAPEIHSTPVSSAAGYVAADTSSAITNEKLLTTSPVFRLVREYPVALRWLHSSEIPQTTSPTTLHNSVTKEFRYHILAGEPGTAAVQRRRRTLLYSPYMTFANGITLGCVFGSKYAQDQVWGLGWDDHHGSDDRAILCKFVYDEGNEESLTFIWNESKHELAIVWVKGISAWETRREMFVFESRTAGIGVGGLYHLLEGKRRKTWLKVRQLRECEACGLRMDHCSCDAHARQEAVTKNFMTSPVDFTAFDVKVLDGAYRCVVEANIYNPDTFILLSRKAIKFTTEIVRSSGYESSPPGSQISTAESQGQMITSTTDIAGTLETHALNPPQQRFSEKLIQHLQKHADAIKTEDQTMDSLEQASTEYMSHPDSGSPDRSEAGDGAETSPSSSGRRRNAHKLQPIQLEDMVNLLYKIEREGASGDSGSDSGRKRRKKRGPYRKRGEVDKAVREHERKLKNRELAHLANQKKRERTRQMEFEVRVLRKAVRSMLGYTRELEDINAILGHIVAQYDEGQGSSAQLSTALTSTPTTSVFPDIAPPTSIEEKPRII